LRWPHKTSKADSLGVEHLSLVVAVRSDFVLIALLQIRYRMRHRGCGEGSNARGPTCLEVDKVYVDFSWLVSFMRTRPHSIALAWKYTVVDLVSKEYIMWVFSQRESQEGPISAQHTTSIPSLLSSTCSDTCQLSYQPPGE
jgi:hypothetical protein